MKHLTAPDALLLLAIALFLTPRSPAATHATQPLRATHTVSDTYGKLPLGFEQNRGQAGQDVQFLAHGRGYTLLLRSGDALLSLNAFDAAGHRPQSPALLQLRLLGANLSSQPAPDEPQITRTNYFLGNDPTRWHTDIPNYGRVRYSAIYPGIDLVYYGNQRRLEHDFLLAPHANPSQIRLAIRGAQSVAVDPATGDLLLQTAQGEVRLLKPVSYQQAGDRRTEIPSRFHLLAHHQVSFSLGSYNSALPLTIDPILVYSTYLGGSGNPENPYYLALGDEASGIAADRSGNAYLVGTAVSPDFPVTSGAYQVMNKAFAAQRHTTVFVSKLNASGTQLIYSTYLGGAGSLGAYGEAGDFGLAIALDAEDNAYITGQTHSSDFPVTSGAFQSSISLTGLGYTAAFVTKLNSTGSSLLFSTFLGGSKPNPLSSCQASIGSISLGSPIQVSGDTGTSIAVDADGNTFLAGATCDTDFPVTPGAFQTENHGAKAGLANYFVTKLNPQGTGLLYSTYLGGSGQLGGAGFAYDYPALAIDSQGNAYLAGRAYADDFPVTAGAYQTVNRAHGPNGSAGASNAFVTKLNPSGTGLVYSTFLGGSEPTPAGLYTVYQGDYASGIAIDSQGAAYVVGGATSMDFPVSAGVVGATPSGQGSAFIAKLNPDGSAVEYSSFLGLVGPPFYTAPGFTFAAGNSFATGIALDASGNPLIAGVTGQFLFPSTPHALASGSALFLAKLNPDATSVLYATTFGPPAQWGDALAFANAIALDPKGYLYLAGYDLSSKFPTTSGAFQTVNKSARNAQSNAVVAKFDLSGEITEHFPDTINFTSSAPVYQLGQPVTLTTKVTGKPGGPIPTGTVTFSGYHFMYPTNNRVDFSQVVHLDTTGTATFTSSTFAQGTYAAWSTYSGDANYLTNQYPYIQFANFGAPQNFYLCGHLDSATPATLTFPYDTPSPCTVTVSDSESNRLPGIAIGLSSPNLVFSPPSAVTDSNGTATFTISASSVGYSQITPTVSGVPAGTFAPYPDIAYAGVLNLSIFDAHRNYGAPDPHFTYQLTGLRAGDTVTVTPTPAATAISPIGAYPITATISGPKASDYQLMIWRQGTLTVLKAPLNVVARSVVSTYGQVPTLSSYTLLGFANGETASVVTGAPVLSSSVTATTPAGTYPIAVSTGTLSAANYYFVPYASGEGHITVVKAHLTLHPASFTIHVGDALPTFTYTITGFVSGDTQATALSGTPSLTTTATSTAKPGRFYIVARQGTLTGPNYLFNPPSTATDGILTILP